jgi:hypothetical protein
MLINIECIYRCTIYCKNLILCKCCILRFAPAGLWWQVDWNFFTQDRRERERAGERERQVEIKSEIEMQQDMGFPITSAVL